MKQTNKSEKCLTWNMDQKKTRWLCVGKVNIFIVYNNSYKEEIGKNVLCYKVVNTK